MDQDQLDQLLQVGGCEFFFYDVFGQPGSITVRYQVKTNPTRQEQRAARAKNKRRLAAEAAQPKKRGRPPKADKKDPSKKAEGEHEGGDEADFSMEEELEKKDQAMKTERELDDNDHDEKPRTGRGKGNGKGRRLRTRKVVKERTAASKTSPKKKDPEESEKNKESSHMHAVRLHDCAHVHQLHLLARTLHLSPPRFKLGISMSHFVLSIIILHAGA